MPLILYADSDQLYMSAIKLLLEQHGFKVLLARSRDHLREVLLANVVDVALIDQDFARACPPVLSDVRGLSPLTRTLVLGMRSADFRSIVADGYCARLDGPERLIAAINAAITPAVGKTAHAT